MESEIVKKNKILSFPELLKKTGWNKAVLVFTESSFPAKYDEKDRSYIIESTSDWLKSTHNDNSVLFGACLSSEKDGDGKDININLSYYLTREFNPWRIEYCYIIL